MPRPLDAYHILIAREHESQTLTATSSVPDRGRSTSTTTTSSSLASTLSTSTSTSTSTDTDTSTSTADTPTSSFTSSFTTSINPDAQSQSAFITASQANPIVYSPSSTLPIATTDSSSSSSNATPTVGAGASSTASTNRMAVGLKVLIGILSSCVLVGLLLLIGWWLVRRRYRVSQGQGAQRQWSLYEATSQEDHENAVGAAAYRKGDKLGPYDSVGYGAGGGGSAGRDAGRRGLLAPQMRESKSEEVQGMSEIIRYKDNEDDTVASLKNQLQLYTDPFNSSRPSLIEGEGKPRISVLEDSSR